MTDFTAAAAALLTARSTGAWLAALPVGAQPRDDAEAYRIQDMVAASIGPVGGWKVGAGTATAEPFRGPIQQATIFDDGAHVPHGMLHLIGAEAELAYRMRTDLPPRDAPYGVDEVMDAIEAIHPVIEVLDTRFGAIGVTDPLSHRADHQNSGVMVVGPACRDWRDIRSLEQPVRFFLNGTLRHEGVGGNSAGDNIRLLVWMANIGTRPAGGLKAGQVVTTGSCSGTDWVQPGTHVRAEFPGIGTVEATLG